MKFVTILLIAAAAIADNCYCQTLPAYKIFDRKGKEVSFTDMMKSALQNRVIFFGELHNNPVAHWLELEVAQALYKSDSSIAIGMEMFEADDQLVVNEYLHGLIDERNFLKEAKIWENYKTDYAPVVEFARQKHVSVIATSMPRRYASLVYKKGIRALDSLPSAAKATIAPLPIAINLELPGYKSMVMQMGGHAEGTVSNLATSQAVKDATMAHFISTNLKNKFLHINGSYHSQNDEGIVWYLKKNVAGIKVLTIQTVEQSALNSLKAENQNLSDFIICIPENMTKTF